MTPEEKITALVEGLQALSKLVAVIENQHNDKIEAQMVADDAMEEAAELENGPY